MKKERKKESPTPEKEKREGRIENLAPERERTKLYRKEKKKRKKERREASRLKTLNKEKESSYTERKTEEKEEEEEGKKGSLAPGDLIGCQPQSCTWKDR